MRLIQKISSPLLDLHVGQSSSFLILPTSIKEKADQIEEAGGQVEDQQEDLLPSTWPPGRTAFSIIPTSIKDREDQIQEAGGQVEAKQEDFLPSPWPPSTAFIHLPPPYLN